MEKGQLFTLLCRRYKFLNDMETPLKHILIVDNDPISRQLFGGLLAKAGYEVLYAGSGEEGRELARRLHPDLILMDINMPGGDDGFKTADRLKNEPNSPAADITIVLLTSNDLSIEAKKWMTEFGIKDYIQKGVSNKEFIERVKKIFEEIENKTV